MTAEDKVISMKSWEFRNIFHDLNDIEKQVLLSCTVPDLVVVRKLADIRIKLLENYKDYGCDESPLIDRESERKEEQDKLRTKTLKVHLNEKEHDFIYKI